MMETRVLPRQRPARRSARSRRLMAIGFALAAALLYLGTLAAAGAPLGQDGATVAYPAYSQRWRFGICVGQEYGQITNYDVGQLCAGWYHTWTMKYTPAHPDGMEFVQTVRVKDFNLAAPETYDWATLEGYARANPGSLWQIGNEPDGDRWASCDNRTPTDYAKIFKLFHDRITAVDPTAQLANGPIIQASPVRVDCWLTKVWDEYRRLYGEDIPVDVWNIHEQILDEYPEKGASIPLTCNAADGTRYSYQQNGSMEVFIDHVQRMRLWMKNHGQRSKPLIISEYGIMMPEGMGFSQDRVIQFMESSFYYLLNATDSTLGMQGDGNRLVQRWAWYAANLPMDTHEFNGTLYDITTNEITAAGRAYGRIACNSANLTPTPNTTPLPVSMVREAENGSTHGTMVRATLVSASDCLYVYATQSTVVSDVTLAVYSPRAAEYVIWGRWWAPDWSNRQFGVQVTLADGTYSFPQAEWKMSPSSTWVWDRVSSESPAVDPMRYALAANKWYTIRFIARGNGAARLDKIVITSNLGWAPGPGDVAVCNPTPSATPTNTYTPTVTRTPTRTVTPTPSRTNMPYGPGAVGGSVSYQGRGAAPSAAWSGPLIVTAHLPGDPIPAYTFNATTNNHGQFVVPAGIVTGTYDVGVRDLHSLRNLKPSVAIDAATAALDMGLLREGDANLDNWVNAIDFSILNTTYFKQTGDVGFDARADFNDDEWINALDFSLLNLNYFQQGDALDAPAEPVERQAQAWPADASSAGLATGAPLMAGNVTIRVAPSTKTVADEQIFTLDVYLDAGANPVDSVDCVMSYSTAYLQGLSITPGTTLPLPLGAVSVSGGVVQYHRGVYLTDPPTTVSGSFKLFTLQFRALAPTGSTSLAFDPDNHKVAVAGGGLGHTVYRVDGVITILAATATPTRTNTPPITPVTRPSATPTTSAGIIELVLQQGEGYLGFEDTFLDSYAPLKNNDVSAEDNRQLKLRSNDAKRILLRADLADLGIPADAAVVQAWLTLYPTYDGHRIQASIYGVERPWDVRAATWVSATQALPWDAAGCDAPNTDRAEQASYERDLFPTIGDYLNYPFTFVITDLVQRWVADADTNYGLLIASSNTTNVEYGFRSSQSTEVSLRPRLVIRYLVGATLTPSPTPSATETPTISPTTDETRTATPTPSPTLTQTSTVTPSPTPSITPTSTLKGAIEGVVFLDLLANDIYDPGEPGVANVTVQLLNQSNALLDEMQTNVIGGYAFANLPAGSYRIRAISLPQGYALVDPDPRVVGLPGGVTWTVNLGLRRVSSYRLSLPYILRGDQP